MTAELVDITELAEFTETLLADDQHLHLLIVVDESGDRASIEAAVVRAFSEPGRPLTTVRVTPGSGKTEALITAWRSALVHDMKLRDLANRTSLDPDALLELLGAELTRSPRADAPGASLSEGERQILVDAGVDLSGPPADADDPAVITAARFARLLADALSVEDAAARLHVTPGRVRQRLAERTLYGVQVRTRGSWRLPAWQFAADSAVPGLETVLPHVPCQIHPLAVSNFFTRPDPDLEIGDSPVSPVDWLRSGGDAKAVAALAGALAWTR